MLYKRPPPAKSLFPRFSDLAMNPNFPDLELHATDAFAAQKFNFSSNNVSTPITIPSTPDQNLLELTWRNGPVMNEINGEPSQPRSPAEVGSPTELFMADDEMLAWLHCQIEDYGNGGLHGLLVDFSLDGDGGSQIAEKENPPPAIEAATVAESNETPAVAAAEDRDAIVAGDDDSSFPISSSSSSEASGERKRKATEEVAPDSRSEDTNAECGGKNRSKRTRRRRDAEVHNKSERRRRNKIKGKLKALLELIPSSRISCKKTDQVSTLDETIDYMRSLKVQAQMLGTGMMYTGVPTYYPSMGIGMAPMGMAMGMNAGMTVPPDMGGDGSGGGRPFPRFGNVAAGPPVAGAPMAFFLPPHMMPVMRPSSMPIVDQFRAQIQQDQAMNFFNFMHVPPGGGASFYVAPHHLHASSQAQVMIEPQAPKVSEDL